MLSFDEYKRDWSYREDYLRQQLGTARTGTAFWDLAYKHYVRLEGYATIRLIGPKADRSAQH